MTSVHLQSSLSQSPVEKWRSNSIVKAKIKLTVSFTMTNGSGHRRSWAGEAIIIRRSDVEHVHDYARQHACPRDFLIIHIPMKIGLRNSEIRTLKIENIDFENRSFEVLDSKKYELFPLPLDMLSLELIQDLIGERCEGYVFTHMGSWTHVKADEPLSRVEIWQIVHDIAEEAGIKGFNPRILRHYFAAMWFRQEDEECRNCPYGRKKPRRDIETLRKILRHGDLGTTQIYLSKLTFFEDLQEQFEGIQNSPLVRSPGFEPVRDLNPRTPMGSICNDCALANEVCKVIEKYGPLPSCASECRFKLMKKEELKI